MAGESLAARLRDIFKKIKSAQQRSARASPDVQILAVSKGQTVGNMKEAHSLGLNLFGENYVQEWLQKREILADLELQWHFIGHLQTNKVKQVVGLAEMIQSMDRLHLAEAISRVALANGTRQGVLLEVNVAGEKNKSGVSPAEAPALLAQMSQLAGINLHGLMIMPPLAEKAEDNRVFFAQAKCWLADWKSQVSADHVWKELSMGTSNDFEVAVEEGATIIRLGTSLFGPRPAKELL